MCFCFVLDSPKSLAIYEPQRHEEEVSDSLFFESCVCLDLIILILWKQNAWVSSPKDSAFPETIPEEASSVEEERVVIFRIPYGQSKPSFYTVCIELLLISNFSVELMRLYVYFTGWR